MNAFTKYQLIHSETSPVEVGDNLFVRVTVERDDCAEPPWEMADGHGPVSDWTQYRPNCGMGSKAPGQRVLCTDGRMVRFYDYAAAMELLAALETLLREAVPVAAEIESGMNVVRMDDAEWDEVVKATIKARAAIRMAKGSL